MRRFLTVGFILAVVTLASNSAAALPLLEQPVPLPASFEGIITIYPDSQNTTQIRRFWLVPTTARIVRNPATKNLEFGLVHSGLTSLDAVGVRGLMTVTIQPYVDDKTMASAKALIEAQAKKEGATSVTFSFIAPHSMSGWLMVGGHPSDFWQGTGSIAAAGGTVDAGYPFQIAIKDDFDVRALTQAGADAASIVGARFHMKFDGLTNPCSFAVEAEFKQLYEHFKARVSASGWFGLVRASANAEWQTLRKQPWVKFTNNGCDEKTIERYYALKLIDSLLTQLTNSTGNFAPALKPNGIPDAPGGGGLFGWSFNASGGYERVEEVNTIKYSVDIQARVTEEIAFGFSFPTASAELRPYIKNISDTNKPIPTSADVKVVADANRKCIQEKVSWLQRLFADGAISKEFLNEEVQNTVRKGCYGGAIDEDRLTSLVLSQRLDVVGAMRGPTSMIRAQDVEHNEAVLRQFLGR